MEVIMSTDETTKHRWDRPTDDEALIQRGREAFERLANGRTWDDWIAVGEALLIGRTAAMREAHTNEPKGGRYNEIFGLWLRHYGFDRLDKSDRAKLMEVMNHRAEIEAWRTLLPSNKRMLLNHPTTVLRNWKASTQIPRADRPPSPMAQLQAAHVEILEENDRLRRDAERGGGDLWTAKDTADQIAKVMADKLTLDKLERTARAMLVIAKQRRQARKAADVAAEGMAAP
jgi:hypothetical protein